MLEDLETSLNISLGTLADIRHSVGLVESGGSSMSVDFSSPLSSQQPGVGSGGGDLSELIEGEALTAGGQDSSSGGLRESEGADSHLGDDDESLVVEDGADEAHDSVGLVGAGELHQSTDRHGELADSGLVQPLEHDAVEGGVSSSGQESIKLDQKLHVDVLGLGVSEVSLLCSASFR